VTISLDGNFCPKDEVRGRLHGLLAVRLAIRGAVDAAEADAFRVVVYDLEVSPARKETTGP
jgi:hypothetical protein